MQRAKKLPEKREPGRPPRAGAASDVRYLLRMTADERELWETAAAAAGLTLAQWIRERCNLSARRST